MPNQCSKPHHRPLSIWRIQRIPHECTTPNPRAFGCYLLLTSCLFEWFHIDKVHDSPRLFYGLPYSWMAKTSSFLRALHRFHGNRDQGGLLIAPRPHRSQLGNYGSWGCTIIYITITVLYYIYIYIYITLYIHIWILLTKKILKSGTTKQWFPPWLPLPLVHLRLKGALVALVLLFQGAKWQ